MPSWEAWALGAVFYVILAALLVKLVFFLLSAPAPAGGATGATALTPKQFLQLSEPLVFWAGPTSAGPCLLYTFPSEVDENGVSYPGFPTGSSEIISRLPGQNLSPACLLPNQQIYQYMSQTCDQTIGGKSTQGLSQCWNLDGGRTPPGGVQYFYSSDCPSPPPCKGSLSYLSLGFFPQTGTGPGQIPTCLSLREGLPFNYECNILDLSQQVLVSRKLPASTSSSSSGSGNLSNDASGGQAVALLKIFGVQAQGCLQPVSSNPAPLAGASGVFFGPCSQNDGYTWLSVPPQPAVGGGFTPPQLVYVGNYVLTFIPNHPPALVPWLQKNALSLVGSGNSVFLAPYFAQGNDQGTGPFSYLSYVTQFIDYAAYQQQVSGKVCLLPNQTDCVPI